MVDVFKKIRSVIGSILQIGKNGPQIKDNSGVIEFRNADDNGFVRVKVAAPVDDNDVVSLKFFKTSKGNVKISAQADCSTAIPNNTAVARYLVVTTSGSGANIGDLLYDDGSSIGTMEIIVAESRTIAVTLALTGGTATFDADSIYIWDEEGVSWLKIGDIGSATGAKRVIRMPVDNSATQDSDTSLPANCVVSLARLVVSNGYSGGASISIGIIGDTSKFIASNDVVPQVANRIWDVEQDTVVTSESVVRVSITGSPAAGSGFVIIEYSNPNA